MSAAAGADIRLSDGGTGRTMCVGVGGGLQRERERARQKAQKTTCQVKAVEGRQTGVTLSLEGC